MNGQDKDFWKWDLYQLFQDILNAAEVKDWGKIEARADDIKIWALVASRFQNRPDMNEGLQANKAQEIGNQTGTLRGILEVLELIKTVSEELVYRPMAPNWGRLLKMSLDLEIVTRKHIPTNNN